MRVRIDAVEIGERRREDLGDLSELAGSIAHYGLLHPIIVDSENQLVAGERRLRACAKLGMEEIEARDFGDLTQDERREIELEENLRRKELTAYEASKTMTELAEVAGKVEANSQEFLGISPRNPWGGRPPKADADARVGARLGVDQKTINNARHHAATADAYPFMQSKEWSQSDVLKAKKFLDPLPPGEQETAAAMVTEPGVPQPLALAMLDRISTAPPMERKAMLSRYRSSDERENSLAMTWAAERAPEPDPRLAVYRDCIRELKRSVRKFPDDPEVSEVSRCITILEAVVFRIGAAAEEVTNGAIDA